MPQVFHRGEPASMAQVTTSTPDRCVSAQRIVWCVPSGTCKAQRAWLANSRLTSHSRGTAVSRRNP